MVVGVKTARTVIEVEEEGEVEEGDSSTNEENKEEGESAEQDKTAAE